MRRFFICSTQSCHSFMIASCWVNAQQTSWVKAIYSAEIWHRLQVLVLGLCFFAGGLKFSEQGFDPSKFGTARQFLTRSENTCSCYSDSLLSFELERRRRPPSSSLPFYVGWCYLSWNSENQHPQDEPCGNWPTVRVLLSSNCFNIGVHHITIQYDA